VKKRYSYRAYPTPGQERALARTFGCVRVVFNDAVAAQRAAYETTGKSLAGAALSAQLAAAKKTPEREWLSKVSSVPLQQAVGDADKALRSFFDSIAGRRKGKRVNPPKFKNKHSRQAARFTRNAGFKVRETTHGVGLVRLSKVGDVRFALSRALPSAPGSVTVTRDPDGRYFLSFVVEVEPAVQAPQHPGRAAALDLGLTDFAAIVYSDGTREKIANPRHLARAKKRLTRAQRDLARKGKGSNNRAKARVRVAREHAKVRNSRLDFHHQLSTRIVRENQTVAVEKLGVVGLARSGAKNAQGRGLRRSVSDVGWGQFLALLADKSAEYERGFAAVNPAYTSQVCSVCGVLDGPKPLGIREWQCGGCAAHLDRDFNAAVNILVAAGQAETLNARGGDIRLRLAAADPCEARTHRTDRGLAAAAA
jgi:putative transposase